MIWIKQGLGATLVFARYWKYISFFHTNK